MASNRNTVLDAIKTTLENITVANSFNYDVYQVSRKFLYYDNVFNFPYLLVLGAGEIYEDQLGDYTVSRLTVRIMGYHKDKDNPELAQCKLIEDVLKCLESDTYNTYKSKMRPISIDTDEGVLHDLGEGLSMFVLNLEVIYRFKRTTP
jgi:hypothetical protein